MADLNAPFPDNTDEYRLQNQQLERRRALARSLIEQGMQGNSGSGYQGGKVFVVGSPLGNIAQSIGGAYLNNKADSEQQDLAARQSQAQNEWQAEYANAPDMATKQNLLMQARNKGLRYDLEQQFAKQEQDQIEKGAQSAADRVARAEEAEANRIERGEQAAADRVARKELRETPTIHITTSGGSGSDGFGGAAPVIGSNPRDDSPIYRHTKSGKLFQYGADGQPLAYEGIVAPKPAAAKEPTESERGAAGYLGRMEATEKNLGNAQPFPLSIQVGLDRAPTAVNMIMTPEQQVQRQQQEDWVRAKLRKESGAVIGDAEMAREIRTYFPMAGDSKEVIRQKAQSRAQALEQMRSSAGRSKPTTAPAVPASDKLTPQEQAELEQLRAKHRKN